MNEVTLHPDVYRTGKSAGLVDLLNSAWTAKTSAVDGTLHLISGFGNYNGGVRFFEIFRRHIAAGGTVNAYFAGSKSARLTSQQLVAELLDCGATVTVINRKRLLHAKAYGRSSSNGERLIITSGNFTGPGMTQNVEMAVSLDEATTQAMGFDWHQLSSSLCSQGWDYYYPDITDPANPAWQLLYDEVGKTVSVDESELISMILTLGHADTARINAAPGTPASRGTQYFWLSKDCYGFFPALNIRNTRGAKTTYSCLIRLHFHPLGTAETMRVTFEADNNLDFRLGTGPLKSTGVAAQGDVAVITRQSYSAYSLHIARKGTPEYDKLRPYATSYIGHKGKKYGYVPNSLVEAILP